MHLYGVFLENIFFPFLFFLALSLFFSTVSQRRSGSRSECILRYADVKTRRPRNAANKLHIGNFADENGRKKSCVLFFYPRKAKTPLPPCQSSGARRARDQPRRCIFLLLSPASSASVNDRPANGGVYVAGRYVKWPARRDCNRQVFRRGPRTS